MSMTTEQRMLNRERAVQVRVERNRLRAEVRDRPRRLIELMDDPPDALLSMRLWEVLTWARSRGAASKSLSIERIAGEAVGRHINLGRMVGDAPLEWRTWVAERAIKGLHGVAASGRSSGSSGGSLITAMARQEGSDV